MKKRNIIGLLTILVGLTGLGGLWLIGQLNSFPFPARVIVFNAIFFKGICGLSGGILIWRGVRWGYYITLVCWLYLIVVSFLSLIQIFGNEIELSYGFLEQNYSTFGRSFLIAVLKIVMGIPIIHIIFKDLLKSHRLSS